MRKAALAMGLLGLSAAYFLAARLGLSITFVNASASPVWPPTGLAIGALLVWGYRLWPGIWVGALAANYAQSSHFSSSVFIATGNSIEALVACWLIHRYQSALHSPGNILQFIGLVAAACVLSAGIGVAALLYFELATLAAARNILFTWWLGDVLGAIILTPVIVFWATREEPLRHPRESVALIAIGLLLTTLVFGPWNISAQVASSQLVLLLPIIWGAFRITPRLSATLALGMASVAIAGTLYGYGPYGEEI